MKPFFKVEDVFGPYLEQVLNKRHAEGWELESWNFIFECYAGGFFPDKRREETQGQMIRVVFFRRKGQ